MIITDIIKNKIEDAFIWFEDEKYAYSLSSGYICPETQQQGGDLYTLTKLLGKDTELDISTVLTITLSKSNSNRDVKTFYEWQEYNSNLVTALRRLGYSTEKITVDDYEGLINIRLYGNSFTMKNCKKLTELCKNFNKEYQWNNLLSAKPFYNPNTNEVEVYIIGSGGKKGDHTCFDLFDICLKAKYKEEKKDMSLAYGTPSYEIHKIRERSGINEFFTIKQIYFHWSDKADDYVKDTENVEKNPYLSNIINDQLGEFSAYGRWGWVLAKVKPINFDI